jgi:hypothetical protein
MIEKGIGLLKALAETFSPDVDEDQVVSGGVVRNKIEFIIDELEGRPKTFEIGQKVRIIGPHIPGYIPVGGVSEFVISQKNNAEDEGPTYRAAGLPRYPASSLELVDDLKIGDLVEIVGPAEYGAKDQIGRHFKISDIPDGNRYRGWFSANDTSYCYPASSLRKIDPREKETIGYKTQECVDGIEKGMQAIRDLLKPLVDDRLSGIEKQLADLKEAFQENERQDMLSMKYRSEGMADHRGRIQKLEAKAEQHDEEIKGIYDILAIHEEVHEEQDTYRQTFAGSCQEMTEKMLAIKRDLESKILDEQKIQVGDWVQVMGSQVHVFRVSSILPHARHGYLYSGDTESGWHMGGNLQKLPEVEISARLNGGQP